MNDTLPIHDADVFGHPNAPQLNGALRQRFGHPPFTVLNCREGEWQDRKRAWIRLGIRSELGRGANLINISDGAEAYRRNEGGYAKLTPDDLRALEKRATPGGGGGPNSKYFKTGGKKASAKAFNMGLGATKENGWAQDDDHGSGTSIFDPVLCEVLYSWFSPFGGQVIDPFAGGSVRGIVAGCLGRKYWGCDLSAPQIAANKEQVGILPPGAPVPVWVNGDSAERVPSEAPPADFLIACPPYFDLEVYSDDSRDLSRMDWDGFRSEYDHIIGTCADKLRPDRFAAFVVGDVRGPDGNYRNLPGYTAACFRRAGMELYNEMILITAVGSLSIRTERQFTISRKLGRTHQTVLVFVKGDARCATDAVTGLSVDARRELLDRRAADRKKAVSGWADAKGGV